MLWRRRSRRQHPDGRRRARVTVGGIVGRERGKRGAALGAASPIDLLDDCIAGEQELGRL